MNFNNNKLSAIRYLVENVVK